MMTPQKEAAYREARRQTDAIFALEGFEPTEQSRAIDEAVIAGRVTNTQAVEEMVAYVKEHKTLDGFIQSRPWAKAEPEPQEPCFLTEEIEAKMIAEGTYDPNILPGILCQTGKDLLGQRDGETQDETLARLEADLTMGERLTNFEIAQETIGFMMAMRTSAIHKEQKKPSPDAAKIAQWEAEFTRYADELDALRLDDTAGIQHVLDDYCPIVKADFERAREQRTLAEHE